MGFELRGEKMKKTEKDLNMGVIWFRENYKFNRVHVTYYPGLDTRFKAFCIALEKSISMLVVAFRVLLRIDPYLD